MTWLPIAQTPPQYEDLNGLPASGYVLKFYAAGTTTNINLATDSTGGTQESDVVLDSRGFPSLSNTVFIPHLDQTYKITLYATQAAADSDTGAIWSVDNITPASILASTTDELLKVTASDTTAGYLSGKLVAGPSLVLTEQNVGSNETLKVESVDKYYDTLALAVADIANISIGDVLILKECTAGNGGGATWDAVDATTVTENGIDIVAGNASISFQIRLENPVNSNQLGLYNDGTNGIINASVINRATTIGEAIIEPGTYKVQGQLTFANALSCPNGKAILEFESTTDTLIEDNSPGQIKGLVIDASACTNVQYGYKFDIDNAGDYKKKIAVVVNDISNTDNTESCQGVLVFQSSGGTALNKRVEIKASVTNVTATANTVIGDNGGSATGINVSLNKTGTDHHIEIINPFVKGVAPVEDGDGIVVFHVDKSVFGSKGSVLIDGAIAVGNAKRNVKIQHHNTKLVNSTIDTYINSTTATTLGVSIYARNVIVSNTNFYSFTTSGGGDFIDMLSNSATADVNDNVEVSDCVFSCSNKSRIASITGTRNFLLSNLNMIATGTAATVGYTADYGQIRILDSTNGNIAQGVILGGNINCVDESSSGVVFDTPCNAVVTIGGGFTVVAAAHGINASAAGTRANIKMVNSNINSDLACVRVVNAQTLTVKSSELTNIATTGTVGGINVTDIQGQVIVKNNEINGFHGVLSEIAAAEAIVEGNTITANSTGSGVGVGIKTNGITANNKIKNFATGNQFTNSTAVKSAGNLFINCTANEVTTGSTGTITYDNN